MSSPFPQNQQSTPHVPAAQDPQNVPVHARTNAPAPAHPTTPKSKVSAILLALFLGGFGAHNFYLGYTGKAWCQLVLTVLGMLTSFILIGFLFTIPVAIWVIIEFIMIITGGGSYSHDAQGRPVR